jgi:predicted nucleic acid-binding protein
VSQVLLDTDVLIDHLRGHHHLKIDSMVISVITRTELYAGEQREERPVETLLARLGELDVNATIARRAGQLQRESDLKIADALIAATALEHELSLMTRNVRHFARVPGLDLRVP